MFQRFFRDERGATSIEYAAVGALLSIAILTGAQMIGMKVLTNYFAPLAAVMH